MNPEHDAPIDLACSLCGSPSQRIFRARALPLWRCLRCKLERIHPQPDDPLLQEIYAQGHFDSWTRHEGPDPLRELKRATFRRLLARLQPAPAGARLLDCGAGSGFLVELAQEKGFDAHAVELSPSGAGRCREILGASHVFEGDPLDSAFGGRFDCITMIDFLEHVRDPQAMIRWAAGQLEEHGTLLVVTPDTGSHSRRLLGSYWPHYHREHLWYFSRSNIVDLLARLGFAVETITSQPKSVSLDYAQRLLSGTEPRASGRWIDLACTILPRSVTRLSFPIWSGDMVVLARSQG